MKSISFAGTRASWRSIVALVVLAAASCTDEGTSGPAIAAREHTDGGDSGAGAKVSIIFDTDMGPDVDDAGALAVLHALADNAEIDLLAVAISTTGDDGTPAIAFIDAVDTYHGRPDLPIGLWEGGRFAFNDVYTSDVVSNPTRFPHDLGSSTDQVPGAIALYRQVLATRPDASVTIVCVGPMNNLLNLIESAPDGFSSLSGSELVTAKVRLLVQMGGDYPSGTEFNFIAQPAPGTTMRVVMGWPTPVVFSGFSIGAAIMTGAPLKDAPDDDPVRRAYEIYTGELGGTRQSWDLTAALYAARGPSSDWTPSAPGTAEVDEAGRNTWISNPDGIQSYLEMQGDPLDIANELNGLMTQTPKR